MIDIIFLFAIIVIMVTTLARIYEDGETTLYDLITLSAGFTWILVKCFKLI